MVMANDAVYQLRVIISKDVVVVAKNMYSYAKVFPSSHVCTL